MKKFLIKMKFNRTIVDALDEADPIVLDIFKRLQLLYDQYQKHHLSQAFFMASIDDLKRRFNNNYHKHQKLVLFEREMKWVNMILDFKIFKIGSLRFQVFPMDHKEIERAGNDAMPLSDTIKKTFYEGRPLINVHIEKDTDLSEEAVRVSFHQATKFFKSVFKQYQFEGFVTRTWLIYPGIVKLLDKNSNISKFAQQFEIIASNQATYQALQRVYGTEDLQSIESMEKKTSLEKVIFKNLDKCGVGFGYRPFT
ncbi:MAG TPA: hypothetical protein VKY25_01900 [Erysipelothrix sp.]|nr:hypothetical protein [Erysipelothrix sp.]